MIPDRLSVVPPIGFINAFMDDIFFGSYVRIG